MRTVQTIAYAIAGQQLYCDATEGRPSSVTAVHVHRWDESDIQNLEPIALAGAGVVEAGLDTTLSGAATAGDKSLLVTATTGAAIDRDYLVTGSDGRREWIDTETVVVGAGLAIRNPLHNDYAAGASVQSTRMTVDVSDAWAADLLNFHPASRANPMFRVRWVYVVAGVAHVVDTYFNLARYPGHHGVLPHNVDDMHPGWLDRLPTDHIADQGARLINEAYRSVKLDLAELTFAESAIAEAEVVDELVRYKTIELGEWARFLAGGGDAEHHKAADDKYTKRLNAFVRLVTRVPVRNVDGTGRPAISVGLSRR